MQQEMSRVRLDEMRGSAVCDSAGDKIGTVEEIFYDQQTRVPQWIRSCRTRSTTSNTPACCNSWGSTRRSCSASSSRAWHSSNPAAPGKERRALLMEVLDG